MPASSASKPGKTFLFFFQFCIIKLLTFKNCEIKNKKNYVVDKLSEICLGSTDRSGVTEYARQRAKINNKMADNAIKAILDLLETDHDGIYNQGGVFLEKLYKETILYATPIIDKDAFTKLVEDMGKAKVAAEGGSDVDKATLLECSGKLFRAMGDKLIPYINSLWKGNRVNIEKSGAKLSAERSKVPPPDQPVINRIVRGPESGSIKIYLVRGTKSSQKKRSKKEYRIYMFVNENDATGTEIGNTFDSRKLIGYGVPESVYRFFSVRAENSNGSSLLASKVKYFLLP
jgi:hypothetical protein